MKPGRYAKLVNELVELRQEMVTKGQVRHPATFRQLEEWAHGPLPLSAYKHRAWWSNNIGNYSNSPKPWDLALLTATEVDMKAQTLVFQLWVEDAEQARKNQPRFDRVSFLGKAIRSPSQSNAGAAPQLGLEDVVRPYQSQTDGRHPLRGVLKSTLRIVAGTDLTKPADPDWADRS